MERIGIAASKIAKGNVFLYNFYVVLIAFLFSLFIFILAGVTVFFALVVISYVSSEVSPFAFDGQLVGLLKLCMISLTVIVAIFNILAILKNIKMPKKFSITEKENKA